MQRPDRLTIGAYGAAPKTAGRVEIVKQPDGGYALYQDGQPHIDFNEGTPTTYPAGTTTQQVLEDVKARQKYLFGTAKNSRFYENKGTMDSKDAVTDEYSDLPEPYASEFRLLKSIGIEPTINNDLRRLVERNKAVAAETDAVTAAAAIQAAKGQALMENVQGIVESIIGKRSNVSIETPAKIEGAAGRITFSIDGLKDVIAVAQNAADPTSVAAHEAYHYAEALLLNKQELGAVSQGLKSGTKLNAKLLEVAALYDQQNKTNITSEIQRDAREASAYAFQFHRAGLLSPEPKSVLGKAWAKIMQFYERVANAVRGYGFQSTLDVFDALNRGEMANRPAVDEGLAGLQNSSDARDFAPMWYSKLERAVFEKIKGTVAQVGQVRALLRDLPKGEVEWSGIDEWLDLQNGKVSKQEVMDFLAQNGVQLTETVLGGVTVSEMM
jgi:hypothetical protein